MTLKTSKKPAKTICETAPQRAALKQHAYAELKRQILAGELAGGSVQSVRQLAAQLEMSKTPVHAAIERLEAEGLVTLAPQQGVVVRELSLYDIVNHYEIRQALEPYVMRRLAGQLTAEQIKQLGRNISDLRRSAHEKNTEGFMDADAEFHQLLCGFFRNDEIARRDAAASRQSATGDLPRGRAVPRTRGPDL